MLETQSVEFAISTTDKLSAVDVNKHSKRTFNMGSKLCGREETRIITTLSRKPFLNTIICALVKRVRFSTYVSATDTIKHPTI